MIFDIHSFKNAGSIKLGMTPDQVRYTLNVSYESFKRTPDSEYPCDYFESLGVFVYYKKSGVAEAIEFATPAEPTFDGSNLLSMPYEDLKALLQSKDSNLEIEVDSITSSNLGIGVYSPDADENPKSLAESVIVFEQGYYD